MKKIIFMSLVAMFATSAFAQSAIELAKQQAELNAVHKKMLNAKPTKSAKKEAKNLEKEGWKVPAGNKSIEQQITESQMYREELMTDENSNIVHRFLIAQGMQTAGTYNSGYAAARSNAQTELAAALETQIVAAMQSKIDNAQSSAISAVTVEKFNERARSIVEGTLTNAIPILTVYRRLPNNNFEVQVQLAYDRKELQARLKRNMQKELEMEGDSLDSILDEVISNKL